MTGQRQPPTRPPRRPRRHLPCSSPPPRCLGRGRPLPSPAGHDPSDVGFRPTTLSRLGPPVVIHRLIQVTEGPTGAALPSAGLTATERRGGPAFCAPSPNAFPPCSGSRRTAPRHWPWGAVPRWRPWPAHACSGPSSEPQICSDQKATYFYTGAKPTEQWRVNSASGYVPDRSAKTVDHRYFDEVLHERIVWLAWRKDLPAVNGQNFRRPLPGRDPAPETVVSVISAGNRSSLDCAGVWPGCSAAAPRRTDGRLLRHRPRRRLATVVLSVFLGLVRGTSCTPFLVPDRLAPPNPAGIRTATTAPVANAEPPHQRTPAPRPQRPSYIFVIGTHLPDWDRSRRTASVSSTSPVRASTPPDHMPGLSSGPTSAIPHRTSAHRSARALISASSSSTHDHARHVAGHNSIRLTSSHAQGHDTR